MTKRDFFRILIKLFALYSLILTVFYWIPSNYIYTIYEFELLPVLSLLLFTLLAVLFYYALIKYTDNIINLTKVDKGFDDEFIKLGDLKTKQILMLGIILIGGFLLITNLTDFIQYTFLAFKDKVSAKSDYLFSITEEFGSPDDYFNWTYSAMNIILGYLLLTNHNRISNWLEKK
ncbi:hypothetical protein [uncultured Psychroserpens sp.]|uniref:hypothetical protein n=1 Tax=uncultured Psychroserpens sp. TaxID=255436 RepID=UPI00261EA453|nr:hypothetical protein [uncultured Psychroserpens sp.]